MEIANLNQYMDFIVKTINYYTVCRCPTTKQVKFDDNVKCEYYCPSSCSSLDVFYEGEDMPRRVKKTYTLYEDYLRKAAHISPLKDKK